MFHASQSAIESARSGWWTSHKPAYLQWNIDVNTAESSFTQSLATAKTTLSAALNTAALAFASTDALSIKTHDLALSLVDQTYTTEIANANQTFSNAKSTADRDLTVPLTTKAGLRLRDGGLK